MPRCTPSRKVCGRPMLSSCAAARSCWPVRGGNVPGRLRPSSAATIRPCAMRFMPSTHGAWPPCGVAHRPPTAPRMPSSTPTAASRDGPCSTRAPGRLASPPASGPCSERPTSPMPRGSRPGGSAAKRFATPWPPSRHAGSGPNTGSPVPTRPMPAKKTARSPHPASGHPPRLGAGLCG
jgi:hypothetical protein